MLRLGAPMLKKSLLSASLLVLAVGAFAQDRAGAKERPKLDVRDLDRRLPNFLVDAYPLEQGDRQLHFDLRDDEHREDRFGSTPELQYGFARGWYVKVGVPVFYHGDRLGSGNVEVELFRGEPDLESPRTAFAAALRAVLPSGVDARGLDTDVEGIVTQPLRRGAHEVRAHANLAWEHNASPLEEERPNGFLAVVGFSARLNPRLVGIADVAHDDDPHEAERTSLGEFGFVLGVGSGKALAFGAGFRLAHHSPASRLTLGYQTSF